MKADPERRDAITLASAVVACTLALSQTPWNRYADPILGTNVLEHIILISPRVMTKLCRLGACSLFNVCPIKSPRTFCDRLIPLQTCRSSSQQMNLWKGFPECRPFQCHCAKVRLGKGLMLFYLVTLFKSNKSVCRISIVEGKALSVLYPLST